MNGIPSGHVHAFAYDMLPNLWRCACGETMGDELMPADELFREREAVARISLDELGTLPDDGRAFLTELRDYVTTHPKLEAGFEMSGGDLVISWRWRR